MKDAILKILAEVLEVNLDDVDEEKELAEFFTWDSLAVMSLKALIEKQLSKQVSAMDLWHCEYVYEIIDLVEEA